MRGKLFKIFPVFLFLLLGFLAVAPKANAMVIISDPDGGDCTTIGTWDSSNPFNKICTVDRDVNDSIDINANYITLQDDGNGRTIRGPGTGVGIMVDHQLVVRIKNLKVTGFTNGIFLFVTTNSFLEGNSVFNNSFTGISLVSSNNNRAVKNSVVDNYQYGIFLSGVSSNNQIYNNNFLNNAIQALNIGGINNLFNRPAADGGGNYWSDWIGPDANNDGFVDGPYSFTGGVDNLPLTCPFGTFPCNLPKYIFSGVSQPINGDGSSVFKLGSTIPVKFSLKDEQGQYITDATAKIYFSKINEGIADDEVEAVSTSQATSGNLFRYDSTDNQYIFNLGTKSLSVGTWQIRIELDDGTSQLVSFFLK